jgi:hypothetical protein
MKELSESRRDQNERDNYGLNNMLHREEIKNKQSI